MNEEPNLTITLKWMNGKEMQVQVNELSPAKQILDLAYPANVLNMYPFLIINGRMLDLSLTVKSQNIKNGDTLVVYEHCQTFSCPQDV